jgi:anti-sigma B factor antagonist
MSDRAGSTSEFAATVTSADTSTVIAVRGEVDVATAPILRRALAEADARGRRDLMGGPVVVDLSGVTFIDASGLSVLVGAARWARGEGRMLVLRDPSPATMRVLEITRLLDGFRIQRREIEVGRHAAVVIADRRFWPCPSPDGARLVPTAAAQ